MAEKVPFVSGLIPGRFCNPVNIRNRNIRSALRSPRGNPANPNISQEKSEYASVLVDKEPAQDGASIIQVRISAIITESRFCFFDLFAHQFLGVLWNEEMPLDWGALYGGSSDTQSFCHLFCKTCFDECVQVQAAIDSCLRSRGSFGPSCSVDCNQSHDGVSCQQCGQWFLVLLEPRCTLFYSLQDLTQLNTRATPAPMPSEA